MVILDSIIGRTSRRYLEMKWEKHDYPWLKSSNNG